MGARGRESGQDISTRLATTAVQQRPEPPEELNAEQMAEWRAVVNRLPADWFPRETWGMLAQYCRHVVASNRIAQLINQMEAGLSTIVLNETHPADDESDDCAGFSLKAYDKLLAMQEREGRAMSSLATRMRMTQQSTFDKERKKGKPGARPWLES